MVANIIEKQVTNDIFHIINGLCRSGKRNRDKKIKYFVFCGQCEETRGNISQHFFRKWWPIASWSWFFHPPTPYLCCVCTRPSACVKQRKKWNCKTFDPSAVDQTIPKQMAIFSRNWWQ